MWKKTESPWQQGISRGHSPRISGNVKKGYRIEVARRGILLKVGGGKRNSIFKRG